MQKILIVLVIVFLIIAYFGCDDCYKDNLRYKCEETKCLNNECLIWDDTIKRCGTPEALDNELKRQNKWKNLNDSISFYHDSLNAKNKQIEEKSKMVEEMKRKIEKLEEKNAIQSGFFWGWIPDECINTSSIENKRIY